MRVLELVLSRWVVEGDGGEDGGGSQRVGSVRVDDGGF